jgi:hypothetical protein
MPKITIRPEDHPPMKGESWWIVHPNSKDKFTLPTGAVTLCVENFLSFKELTAYPVTNENVDSGWINVQCDETVYCMPEYLFKRYFDVALFVESVAWWNPKEHSPLYGPVPYGPISYPNFYSTKGTGDVAIPPPVEITYKG